MPQAQVVTLAHHIRLGRRGKNFLHILEENLKTLAEPTVNICVFIEVIYHEPKRKRYATVRRWLGMSSYDQSRYNMVVTLFDYKNTHDSPDISRKWHTLYELDDVTKKVAEEKRFARGSGRADLWCHPQWLTAQVE